MARQTFLSVSSNVRTQTGRIAHVTGMVLAACLLAIGVYLAATWDLPYGSYALLSAFMHATAVYLIGRSIRRIVDRRSAMRAG